MAYLGKYIRQILSKQEPVSLPGFGSLIFTDSKGSIGEDGKIDPPGRIIKFDANHPKEDDKLAKEYGEGEGIEFEEAKQQVLELVDAIKFRIDKGETYKLELLGSFSKDDDNRIHFVKDPNWVVDPELFGLASLELLEIESEEEKVEEKIDVKAKKVQKKRGSAPAASSEKPGKKPVNKWSIIWIVIASLIVVLVLILLIPSGNGIEFSKEGIIIRENEAPNQSFNESRERNDLESAGKIDNGEIQAPVQEEAVTRVIDEKSYFIIAGSFQNLANATELLEKLKSINMPAEIIITENRLYRVSIKSYATKEDAMKELPSIKSKTGFNSAWVLTR